MFFYFWIYATLTKESHINKSEHVEGSKASSYRTSCPEYGIKTTVKRVCICLPKYFVLGEKSREWWQSSNSKRRHKECQEGYRHNFSQATHVAHVLSVVVQVSFM